MWKVLSGIWFVLAVGIIGVWIAHGSQMLTKDKIQVVTKRVNPTFGIEEEIIEWKPAFRLGLEYAAPSAGLCFVVGILCWRIAARSGKR